MEKMIELASGNSVWRGMDYYEKNEQMMELGVNAIPLELWNFGVRYCSGSLRTVPKDVIRQALMPSDKASITDRGVKYKGLYYSSEEALAGLWFEKARAKGTYKTRISYDPRDMGAIIVEDPASKEMIRCELVDWESKYAGKQWEEVCSSGALENGQWLLCTLNTETLTPGLYALRTAFTLPDQGYQTAETYFEIIE